jgi:hypothetical protein
MEGKEGKIAFAAGKNFILDFLNSFQQTSKPLYLEHKPG